MRYSILAAGVLAASTITMLLSGGTAQAAEGFGKSGELAVSWDQPLVAGLIATNAQNSNVVPLPTTVAALGFEDYSVSNNGGSVTLFSLAPAADYFVIDNLSIGAQVLVGVASTSPPNGMQGSTITLYGIAPQIGYNLAITDSISFWPKVFFAYTGASTNNNGPSASTGTIGAFAPFLFHLATHFYVGVGPNAATQVIVNESLGGNMNVPNPSKVTSFGAMATFGGWFSLGGG